MPSASVPLGQLHHGAEKRHGQADAYGAGAAPASLCGVSSGRAGEHFLRGAAPEKKEGHAELKWAFNPDAVGEGKRAEDFHTVLILAEEGAVLCRLRHISGRKQTGKLSFSRRKRQSLQKRKTAEMPKLQEKIDLKAEKTTALSEQKAEPPEAQEKPLSAQGCHGSFQGLLAKFRRELENLEETGVLSAEETANIRAAGKRKIPCQGGWTVCGHRDGKGGQNYGNSGQSGHEWTAKGHPWTAEKAGTVWGWCPLGLSFSGGADPARTNSAEMAEGIFLPAPLQKISSSDSAAGGKRLLARSAGGIQRGGGSRGTALRFREFRRVDGDWGYWMAFLAQEG